MDEEINKPPSEEEFSDMEEEFKNFEENYNKGVDLELLESKSCLEGPKTNSLESLDKEDDSGLHSKFINLSLENDLKGDELEWFRSKISSVETEIEEEKKTDSGLLQVKILTQADLEEPSVKSNKIFLKLSETNTIWFFSLETKYSLDDKEDAKKVQRDNEAYQMKKTKIEFIRRRCFGDAQTPRFIEKSGETLTAPINKADAAVLASEWDLYDTYEALDKCEVAPCGKYLKFVDAGKFSTKGFTSSAARLAPEETANELFKSLDFEYASLVTERLLAANRYQREQLVFKTKYKTRCKCFHCLCDDDTEPTLFSYEIQQLWDFQNDFEHSLFVTDMDWNPLNQDLLAVSYGDLEYPGKSVGLICIWSPKNPRQPERRFQFDDSITSLHYSRLVPNILAFGTRKGNVYITDVSVSAGKLTILTSSKPHRGPIWKVEWFLHAELTFETEKLLAVGEAGVLMLFFPSEGKGAGFSDLLKLNYVTSTENLHQKSPAKKIHSRWQIKNKTFDKKTFSGLYFSIFSDRNFCYVATKEGALVKCNLRNPSMSDGVFLAHDGPVYVIEHSPVTDVVYLTCGADWSIKIWMEGITQSLISLQHKDPVTCAKWSPTIPTLIAAVTDRTLSVWDIARNILSPMTVVNFEDLEQPLSTLLFSTNGANIVLGSQNGSVRIVHLSELPRIPFLQKEALIAAIKQALLKKENKLLNKFSRVVEANKERLETKIVV